MIKLKSTQLETAIQDFLHRDNGLNELLSMILNSLMKEERSMFLSEEQADYNKANGYRAGLVYGYGKQLELSIPRDRLGAFKPIVYMLMKDQQARVKDLCFELYSKGLTTRDIGPVLKTIYGRAYKHSAISKINKGFYKQMALWRNRPIEEEYLVLYIDAIHIKVRRETVSSEAFYVVMGLKPDYTREVIGIYSIPSESASGWQIVLQNLKSRGLKKVDLIVSDGLTGLGNAIQKEFKESKHQKCTVHLIRNILTHIKAKHKKQVAEDFRAVLDPDKEDYHFEQAQVKLAAFCEKWGEHYPYCKSLKDKEDIEYYFTYLKYNYKIRRMVYTTNWIERLNKDFRKTIKIRNSMPNFESVLTLLSSVAIDKNENRYNYKIYNFKFHYENEQE